MHNTYVSSPMCTLISKGSFSLAFNDHSNLLNERFERNPLYLPACCACFSCTSLYTYRVPRCQLYGLRQSKLLQWSVYGVERYLSRLPAYRVERYLTSQPVYGVNHGCREVHSCLRERSVCNGSGRRRQRCVSCCCRESDEGSEIDYQSGVDFAEDVLSLLNEGCGGVKRRYGSSYKRLEAGMSRNDVGREKKARSGRKLQEKKKGDIASELNEVKRKLAELESDLKRHQTVRRIARREKHGEGNNKQEMSAKRENRKRGDVSSWSSYYSGSSLESFSSDAEIEDKYTQIEEELSMEHASDRGREGRVMGKVIEESTSLRDYSMRLGESSDQKNIKVQSDVSLDSRNYRENKIAAMQEMQSRAVPSQMNLEVLRSHEIAGQDASVSCMKFNSQKNNSSVTMNLNDRRERQYSDNQVTGASALPRFEAKEMSESHAGYVKMPSRLKETHLGREDVETSETSMQETSNYLKRRVPNEDDLYIHSVEVISEVEEINKTTNLSKQQDIRRMNPGESQISVPGTDEQLHQSGKLITTCRNGKGTSETLESSQIRESHMQHTNATKMNITNQIMETKINLVSGSSSEAKEMRFGITERKPHIVQPLRESKVVKDMSHLQGTGAETVTFWSASDEGSMSQRTNSTSSFKSFVEMRDSKCQTDENMTEFGSQHVPQPTKVSTANQNAFEEVSGLQGSLHSSAEVRMKQRKPEESDGRNIQEMVRRSSLMSARASSQAEPTTRIRSSDVFRETSEGSSSALSMHSGSTAAFQSEMNSGDGSDRTYHETLNTTTPKDSLGSADRLEKLPSQYIGEFVEKVGSEIQSVIKAVSCGGSGTKGPSDLMRDVRQPSVCSTQRLARGSAHGMPTTMTMNLNSNTGTLENSSSAGCMHSGSTMVFQSGTSGGGGSCQTYHEPFSTAYPEDSLGSADHLKKLSSQFMGEFVEKVKHEDSISEIQRQTEGSELQLAVEVDRLWEPSNTINPEDSLRSTDDGLGKLSSPYVCELVDKVTDEVTISGTQREIEGPELKSAAEVGTYWKNSSIQGMSEEAIQFELASSHSSAGSGTQGHSILMEDVREPSVPSSQQPARGSVQGVPITKITSPNVSCDTSESSCTALVRHSGRSTALQPDTHSPDESGQTYLQPLKTINPEDSLGSNYRLEKSSSLFIHEFLDKAGEVMISRTQGEAKVSELQSHAEIDKSRNDSKNQHDIQDGSQFELASSHSSGDSGLKGPSDIMWDVREPSVQETSKSEEPMGTSPNEKAVVRRTGRTFWSIIGDIVRLRWGLRADAPNMTGRSGERSSSEKSASTEASSSGKEHEDNIKNGARNEKTAAPGSSTSDQLQLRKRFSQSEEKVSETVGSKEMKSPALMMSSHPGTLVSSSVSEDVTSGKATLSLTAKVKSSEGFSTNKEIMELSPPLQVFPVLEEPIVGCSELSKLKSVEHTGQSVSQPETEQPGARKKEAELKRRKLQRTEQVARDRFDDWEEAYKLEFEQKIIDEMFMREALLEAKKAADAWEVPVGAVLVQHGKIISRGWNLVEELRDSTAHAEMICIREASNLLRTWRLSETTLYVTLEPCPMCAGAILQARIDAVVWGAPNKLLGADGSWVRLFPDEVDGSESRDKPAAPIHPFHPKMKIRRGVLASECADMMQQFFQLRRKKKKAEPSTSQPSLPGSHNPAKILAKMHDIFHFMFCL